VAAPSKLTHADVKLIRRRVRAGEHQTDLAEEFGVDRKTIRRRLDELEKAEAEWAERVAANRLRRQAAREKRKLLEREQGAGVFPSIEIRGSSRPTVQRRTPIANPYYEWLDRRKNLTGRAAAEARGHVRVRNADSTVRKWVERSEVEALLETGWLLDDG
jgi:DNA-binding XRE family transcriptional regulator